ncbi:MULTISPECIES: tail fiber domain-containing protein [unclassified Chryseobacterium]|uniref:tail fiber domain-containing protein n=1 Tax=unclassified Chryseobacterium TaxID=2593645 RepID=UPI002269893B|nr:MULTISPECIES: tail fiber domain-containing protein [unclassified Chryseobacterium]
MKKIKHFYPLIAVFAFSGLYAQVGINTANPQSTLDVVGNVASTSSKDGVTAPRLTRQQLAAKAAGTYAAAQLGTLVYVTDATTPTGTTPSLAQTANIAKAGYHYFDGTTWKQLTDVDTVTSSVNIYNSDGTLTSNRVVTQGANTLAFTSTAVNGFSVDGSTLSVDAANDRVGLGTTIPRSRFEIVSDNVGGGAANDFNFTGYGTSKNPALFFASASGTAAAPTNLLVNDIIGALYFTPRVSGAFPTGSSIVANYRGDGTTNLTDLAFATSNAERVRIDTSGNVGIGNTAPTVKLDVNSGGTSTTPIAAVKIVDGNQAAGKILTSDGTGVATWQTPAVQSSVNIYNTNGSLTGNRVVTQAANTLAFTSTAINGFSVDGSTFSVDAANDRVGVGTTTPISKLDVVGDTFGVRRAGAAWDNLWFDISNAFAPSINVSGAETGLQFNVGANATGAYGDGQTLTTVATLRPNGNVGIGTAAPNSILDLGTSNGAASVTAAAGKKLAIFNNAAGTDFYGLGINTNYLQFHAGSVATAAPGMVLGTSGNVGIGSTAPNRKLHVEGAGYFNGAVTTSTTKDVIDINIGQDGFAYGNRGDNFGINIRSSSTAGTGAVARINFGDENPTTTNGNKYLSFSVGNPANELMYLNSPNGGRVGIGTTTPSAKVSISSSIAGAVLSLQNTSITGNPTLNIYPGYTSNGSSISPGNQYAVVFDQDPGVTTGATRALYDFHGEVRAVSTSTLSDIRLKKDIINLNEYGLKEIMKIQPRRYHFKEYDTPDIGVIAQELKAVVPELVNGNENEGLLSVDYSKLSLILINGMKEQQAEIKEQKKEIDLLKQQVKELIELNKK